MKSARSLNGYKLNQKISFHILLVSSWSSILVIQVQCTQKEVHGVRKNFPEKKRAFIGPREYQTAGLHEVIPAKAILSHRNQQCLDQLVFGKICASTTDYEEFENLEEFESPDEVDIFEDVPEP